MVFACGLQGEETDGWDKARLPGVRSGASAFDGTDGRSGQFRTPQKSVLTKSLSVVMLFSRHNVAALWTEVGG